MVVLPDSRPGLNLDAAEWGFHHDSVVQAPRPVITTRATAEHGTKQPNCKTGSVQSSRKRIGPYAVVGSLMLFCSIYTVTRSFSPTPVGLLSRDCPCDGIDMCICGRETVEALTLFQILCLANARLSAFMFYPLYVLLFLTKAHNLRAFLQNTILSEWIPLTSMHHLHVWAGKWVGVGIMWHGLWHLIRWGIQGNLQLLFHNQTGITGLISLAITQVLVWPMLLQSLRQAIHFELRKRLHYLSWVWAASICFHCPAGKIFWIIGSALMVYLLDWVYGVLARTYIAPSARFLRLESSIMIRVPKPDRFSMVGHGGYCYLCIPWLSMYEWHAFSAFHDPFDDKYVCFWITPAGDWTKKLHDTVTEPIHRRIWLYGPFPSPFENASVNDQIISIASGIGITSALSVIHSLADTRKMHLVWICRDSSLIEFMLDYGSKFGHDAFTFIFYTGKQELVFRRSLPHNVFLLNGRPDLGRLIPSLVLFEQRKMSPEDIANKIGGSVELDREVDFDQDLEVGSAPVLEVDCDSASEVDCDLASETASTVDTEGVPAVFEPKHRGIFTHLTHQLVTHTREELWGSAVRQSRLSRPAVTYEGLHDVFGKSLSSEQLRTLFERVNLNGSGIIDSAGFADLLRLMEEETQKPSYEKDQWGQKSIRSLKKLGLQTGSFDVQESTDNATLAQINNPEEWRLMYCGGSDGMVKTLNEISSKHNIALSVESFEW